MPRKVGPIDYKYLPTVLQFIRVRLNIMRIFIIVTTIKDSQNKFYGFILRWL